MLAEAAPVTVVVGFVIERRCRASFRGLFQMLWDGSAEYPAERVQAAAFGTWRGSVGPERQVTQELCVDASGPQVVRSRRRHPGVSTFVRQQRAGGERLCSDSDHVLP